MRKLIFFFALVLTQVTYAQDSVIVSLDEVKTWVAEHHPVIRAIRAKLEGADAKVMGNNGNFDPSIYGEYDQKYFNETEYYSVGEAGVKVPTWIGVDVKASYAMAQGQYVSNQNTLPQDGMWNLGLEAPIGGSLWWDARRAAVKEAGFVREKTIEEQRMTFNELMLETHVRYVNWAKDAAILHVLVEAEELARQRFEAVLRMHSVGEKPSVDTLESKISWLDRRMRLSEARNDYVKSKQALSAMLWLDENTPMLLNDSVFPLVKELQPVALQDSITLHQLLNEHPELNILEANLGIAENNIRLSQSQLIPDIRIQYNLLQDANQAMYTDLAFQNYKWGASVYIPLFMRKTRGNLRLSRAEADGIAAYQIQKKRDLELKLSQTLADRRNLANQSQLSYSTYIMYQALLQSEVRRFFIGESSVFLVNSRELNMIESAKKWQEVRAKYRIVEEKLKALTMQYGQP